MQRKALFAAASIVALYIVTAAPAGAQTYVCEVNGTSTTFGVATNDEDLACGGLADGGGTTEAATAFGYFSTADGFNASAFGSDADALADYATAIGADAQVTAINGTAVGHGAVAGGGAGNSTAIGAEATAVGQSTAVGADAEATGFASVAVGEQTDAFGNSAVAVGTQARATGNLSTAVGTLSRAKDEASLALGNGANAAVTPNVIYTITVPTAGTIGAVSIGSASQAFGADSLAVGNFALVGQRNLGTSYVGGTALGTTSIVSANQGTALGQSAQALHTNSVALGAGTVTTADNQVHVGGRTISGVAAGTAATDAVNVSQLNAATSGVSTTVTTLQTSVTTNTTAIAANTTAITNLEATQSLMEGQIDSLFDLRDHDRRDMKQGVAAAMSMAQAPMPSAPGRVGYAVNGAAFRGELAVGASLNYRLNTRSPMVIGVGASFAGNKNNGVRVGVAGEF